MANIGYIVEFTFAVFLIYIEPINKALNIRSIASPHFAIPGMIFGSFIFFFDEGRRIMVRRGIE
jgi:hypothetical protein